MTLTNAGWIVASGMGTVLGAVFLFLLKRPSDRQLDTLLGFTAGVMLAATVFSLLVPALERGALWEVVVGLALGAMLLAVLDVTIPHIHARFDESGHPDERQERKSVLLLSALTIHNIPEGMAVGVAFAADGAKLGIPVALAIGLQNIPEGFAAGAPLIHDRKARVLPAVIAGATGLVEPPAAFAAWFALSLAQVLLPAGLAFAGGAMLYVVIDELIPESHARGNERYATFAFLGGFVLMFVLDNAFG